jgi:Zn-dependent protease with chaperone function
MSQGGEGDMTISVLRNKNRDDSAWWQIAFWLALVATIIASSYTLCVSGRFIWWTFDSEMTFGAIFITPWVLLIPMTLLVGHVALGWRKISSFSRAPSVLFQHSLEILGAKPLDEAAFDPHLRRLVNVNEEIAVAAGCRPVELYVLETDESINALTLGNAEMRAVCVTRGALRTLKRAELQAVVAHEYGHVLNDDVGRNMRLLRWLGALLPMGFGQPRYKALRTIKWCLIIAVPCMICAWLFERAGGLSDYIAGWFAVAALVCILILLFHLVTPVWRLGVDVTRSTQAGFTRERELEADAVAAQLTRDPESLALALRKIAMLHRRSGSSPRQTALFAHLSIASGLFGKEQHRFATHPLLEERLWALGYPLTPEERKQREEDPEELVERYAAEVNAELGILYATEPAAGLK